MQAIAHFGRIERASSIYETEPEGGALQPRYLNAVVRVRTRLSARELLRAARKIERRGGRRRPFPGAPRTIDVDLLDVRGERIASRDLVLPHPRLSRRVFVLAPLAEIAPRWRHPVSGRTARRLLQDLGEGGIRPEVVRVGTLAGPPKTGEGPGA